MGQDEQAQRSKALQLVREAYEFAAQAHRTTPELLERINRPRPSWMRTAQPWNSFASTSTAPEQYRPSR
jgi:hypothetical protein